MAYTKTNWVDGTTPASAANMNKIENAISSIETNTPIITDTTTSKKYTFKIQVVSGKPQLVYEEVV